MKQFVINLFLILLILSLGSCASIRRSSQYLDEKEVTDNDDNLNMKEDSKKETVKVATLVKKKVLVPEILNFTKEHNLMDNQKLLSLVMEKLRNVKGIIPLSLQEVTLDESLIRTENSYQQDNLIKMCRDQGIAGVVLITLQDIHTKESGDDSGIFRNYQYGAQSIVKAQVFDVSSGNSIVNKQIIKEANDKSVKFLSFNKDSKEIKSDLINYTFSLISEEISLYLKNNFERLAWQGRILSVDGQRIILNAGKKSGLVVGEVLNVLSEGDEIFDPSSGKQIGRAPGIIKGTVQVVNFFGDDAAVGVVHSGGGFLLNDIVELYN